MRTDEPSGAMLWSVPSPLHQGFARGIGLCRRHRVEGDGLLGTEEDLARQCLRRCHGGAGRGELERGGGDGSEGRAPRRRTQEAADGKKRGGAAVGDPRAGDSTVDRQTGLESY